MSTNTTLVQTIYLRFLWEMDYIRGYDGKMSINVCLPFYHKL